MPQAFGEALQLERVVLPALAAQLLGPGPPAHARGGVKSRGGAATDVPVAVTHTALLNLVSGFCYEIFVFRPAVSVQYSPSYMLSGQGSPT